MLFKLKQDNEEKNISTSEVGYGELVGVGDGETKYLIKFLANDAHETTTVICELDAVDVTDDTIVGTEVLYDINN